MAHAFNASTFEAETGESMCVRLALSTERISGQPGLYRNPISIKQTRITCEARLGYLSHRDENKYLLVLDRPLMDQRSDPTHI